MLALVVNFELVWALLSSAKVSFNIVSKSCMNELAYEEKNEKNNYQKIMIQLCEKCEQISTSFSISPPPLHKAQSKNYEWSRLFDGSGGHIIKKFK